VQDLSQLHRLYTLDENLSGNCQIHVVAATQSARTRDHASGLAGTATVTYRHRSLSAGKGLSSTRRATVAPVEARRPLLTPDELGTLAAGAEMPGVGMALGLQPAASSAGPLRHRHPRMGQALG
jgi:type IV secretory pathway TraG/TraD family ATPase VirD4